MPYASVFAVIAGFVVAALALVMSIDATAGNEKPPRVIDFAAGLLTVSLFGCLLSALAFATLSGFRRPRNTLIAAGMWGTVNATGKKVV